MRVIDRRNGRGVELGTLKPGDFFVNPRCKASDDSVARELGGSLCQVAKVNGSIYEQAYKPERMVHYSIISAGYQGAASARQLVYPVEVEISLQDTTLVEF